MVTLSEDVSTCLAKSHTVHTPAISGRVPAHLRWPGSAAAFLGLTILLLIRSGPADVISYIIAQARVFWVTGIIGVVQVTWKAC